MSQTEAEQRTEAAEHGAGQCSQNNEIMSIPLRASLCTTEIPKWEKMGEGCLSVSRQSHWTCRSRSKPLYGMAPLSVGFAVNALARKARCITEADGWRRFWVSLGAGPARVRSERSTTGLTSRTDSGVKPSMTKIGWASTL